MRPAKVFRDSSGLVALYRADKMPLQGQVAQVVHFIQGFLHKILTECLLACAISLAHHRRRDSFADCKQADLGSITLRHQGGLIYSGVDCLQVGKDCGHNHWRYSEKPGNRISARCQTHGKL